MSGSSIAYHLRSHKSVDRRLFVDLLTRYERHRSLANAVYLSMGAYSLEDHRLIHRVLGINKLVAFDRDADIVRRQKFNRPISTCFCVEKKSSEIANELNSILENCDCSDATAIIIWLDYTDPKEIGSQIREFRSLLDKLAEGDVVRVTVNANPKEIQNNCTAGPVLITKTMENQFKKIKELIGEYLPSTASAADMTSERLAVLLSQAFGAAALKALPLSGRNIFSPLSIVRYADTTQMLSITGVIVARDSEGRLRSTMDLKSWPLESTGWTDIKRLVVPQITLRERLYLERSILDKDDDEIKEDLGFDFIGGNEIKPFLESYRNYYRFYPTFLAAEI